MQSNKVILCILDGYGISSNHKGNAISLAKPQTLSYLTKYYPNTLLQASGQAVGLPEGQTGNSETGHLNIGAGRVVFQDLSLINMAISDGSFFTNPELLKTIKHLNTFESSLHLLGLIGNSGVHAYNEHLQALILFTKKHHVKNVYLHLITDGRDSPPQNGIEQVKKIKELIKNTPNIEIASIMGRYYAMDRDLRLDRTQKAFDCLTQHKSSAQQPEDYLKKSYQEGITDEFVLPVAIDTANDSRIKTADAVIFYNFRTDRPRQLTEMFLKSSIKNLRFVTMTQYQKTFQNPVLFKTTTLKNTLGEVLSIHQKTQLRAAETEKIAMVSYYFNGQNEQKFLGEDHLFINSPKVATYDLTPRMSTDLLVRSFVNQFQKNEYSLGVINIASPDMVAHTGSLDPTIQAINSADDAVRLLVDLAQKTNSYLFVTADHGNAEELLNQDGSINTEHSINPVPFIVYHPHSSTITLQPGKLADIAPTILKVLELPLPDEMNGKNLIVNP